MFVIKIEAYQTEVLNLLFIYLFIYYFQIKSSGKGKFRERKQKQLISSRVARRVQYWTLSTNQNWEQTRHAKVLFTSIPLHMLCRLGLVVIFGCMVLNILPSSLYLFGLPVLAFRLCLPYPNKNPLWKLAPKCFGFEYPLKLNWLHLKLLFFSLGLDHLEGYGEAEQDDELAFKWMEKATLHGCSASQLHLGIFLWLGVGCTKVCK